jgi:O-antigen ligase
MGGMSVGALTLLVCLLVAWKGPMGALDRVRREHAANPWARRYLIVTLALAAALVLSLVVAAIWPLQYAGRPVQVSFGRDLAKTWYLFWPLLLLAVLRALSPNDRARLLSVWLGFALILGAIGWLQYFTGWPRPQGIPLHPGRFHATLFFGHHLSVASVLIFPFFAALDLAEKPIGPRIAGLSRPLLSLAAALLAITLFLTYSRMLWVALPVSVIAWVLWVLPRRLSLGALVTLALMAAAALQAPEVRERLGNTMGVSTRQELWKANLEFVARRPLTGAGWHHNLDLAGAYFDEKLGPGDHFVGHAHNNVIEALGGTGLLGLLAWLAWCSLVIRMAWVAARGGQARGFSRGVVCAWIAFHLNGLTQVNFWESKVLHQITWVVAWSLLWASELARENRKPAGADS